MVSIDVHDGGFDAFALCSELVKTLPATSGDDNGGLGFKVMDSESKRTPKASGGTDDKNTLCVLDSWHGDGGGRMRTHWHLGLGVVISHLITVLAETNIGNIEERRWQVNMNINSKLSAKI